MKKSVSSVLLIALTALCLACTAMPACAQEAAVIDYAAAAAPDAGEKTLRIAASVHAFVDGDTVHFQVPVDVVPSGVLKARFLACNTPESTGKIEEWGKRASAFTREKLENAQAILIESDDAKWNLDSTSTRYLVWVWYLPPGGTEYRNLNIELLQEGLAIANSSAQNRYGDTCMAAIAQARAQKLRVYSGQKDPDYYYGDAIELTLRELRLHPEQYEGKKVAFNGVVTLNHSNSVFLEDYDQETGLYFGISAYYGFGLSGAGLDVLSGGNLARIVGTLQYYEAGQAWQVSGLTYRMMKPKDPGNIQTLSTGHAPSWKETSPETLNSTVALINEDGGSTVYPYAVLAQATTVQVRGLTVLAQEEYADSARLLLRCGQDASRPILVYIDSAVLGALPEEKFAGKTVDVRGVVQVQDFLCCISVYTPDGLTVRNDQ